MVSCSERNLIGMGESVMDQADKCDCVLLTSEAPALSKGPRKVPMFSNEEVASLFDDELVDTAFWGDRRVTDIGKEWSLRTFGVVYDDESGLRVLADTQYFIELRGQEVRVDATTLGIFLSKYKLGGIDAAEKFLNRHSVSVD